MLLKTLTKEQKSKFDFYVKKHLDIGLSTNQNFNKEKCIRLVCNLCKFSKIEAPKKFYFFDSLKSAYDFFQSQVGLQVELQVDWSQVRSQVESQVESQVWLQIWSQVQSQVRSQVDLQVESQVRSQVWSQVWSQVRSQVELQELNNFFNNIYWNNLYSGYNSYYDFFNELDLNLELTVLNEILIPLSKEMGPFVMINDTVLFTKKPKSIQIVNGKLHNESGPSIEYSDGFKIYSFNGNIVSDKKTLNKIQTIEMFNSDLKDLLK